MIAYRYDVEAVPLLVAEEDFAIKFAPERSSGSKHEIYWLLAMNDSLTWFFEEVHFASVYHPHSAFKALAHIILARFALPLLLIRPSYILLLQIVQSIHDSPRELDALPSLIAQEAATSM